MINRTLKLVDVPIGFSSLIENGFSTLFASTPEDAITVEKIIPGKELDICSALKAYNVIYQDGVLERIDKKIKITSAEAILFTMESAKSAPFTVVVSFPRFMAYADGVLVAEGPMYESKLPIGDSAKYTEKFPSYCYDTRLEGPVKNLAVQHMAMIKFKKDVTLTSIDGLRIIFKEGLEKPIEFNKKKKQCMIGAYVFKWKDVRHIMNGDNIG